MVNWDLYIFSPLVIILTLMFFFWRVKKNNVEKKWVLFFLQVICTTSAAMIAVEANISLGKEMSSSSLTVGIVVSLLGSWLLFGAIFKVVYAIVSIKLASRKIIFQLSNVLLLLAICLSFIPTYNSGVAIFIVLLQSFLIGATLGAQSIYFLFLAEQKYNKLSPLQTAFSLGCVIVFSLFIAQWFVGLNRTLKSGIYDLDAYLAIILAVTALVMSVIIIEHKSKIGSFAPRISCQLSPYSTKILVKMVILTLIIGTIYAIMQSPIFKFYILSNAVLNGQSSAWLAAIDRKYSMIFIFAQFFIGYVFYKVLARNLNLNYIFISLIFIAGVTLLLNSLVANFVILWISNFIYGSMLFMMYYFLFAFAIMWNARAVRKPVTGWVTGSLLLSQFIVGAFFSILILTNNNLFPFKSANEIINANHDALKLFVTKLQEVIKIASAIAFAINCAYATFTFFWMNTIIAEYQNLTLISKKMYEIEKHEIERRINSRILFDQ